MGPWLRSHGRREASEGPHKFPELQWGRGFAATEGAEYIPIAKFIKELQWGRGFAATEGGGAGAR